MLPPAPERVTPNSVTRPEMPAVRVPLPEPQEPSTDENSERITHVSDAPDLAPARDRAVLLRLDGVDAGSMVRLDHGTCKIGRHTANQLAIFDGGTSRDHARITWAGNAHMLEDLGSRNGTFVRGMRVTRVVLADGDLIQFGPHACFRYTITDALQERLLKQLYESSTRDGLTGTYNRRHFDERLTAELAYAKRHGSELSMVMLDIDHFKKVNDTHGHVAGDAVIRHIANVAQQTLRGEDVLARYGGEEFAVLLRGIPVDGAVRVAERVRSTVQVLPIAFQGKPIPVTLSAGCAALSECQQRTGAALIEAADDRLYEAKRAGRNRVIGVARKA